MPRASRNHPFRYAVSGTMNLLAIALLVLATSASLGQPAQEGRRNPPDRSREGVEVPRAWGPAIVPELRSRATRDVPMGGGKPRTVPLLQWRAATTGTLGRSNHPAGVSNCKLDLPWRCVSRFILHANSAEGPCTPWH